MKDMVFKDKQIFNDNLVYALLGIGIIGTLAGMLRTISSGTSDLRTVAIYLAIITAFLLCIWWLRRLHLKVSVNDKRIKFKMSPFHNKAQKIPWDEVETCVVVKTPPAAQWHGGNIHFGNENWFSLNGRNGISIATKDGRRLFIGCNNIDRLMLFFNQLNADALKH